MTELDCEQLDDYLDGVLDASSRAVFQRHAANCESCSHAIACEDALRQAALESNADSTVPPEIMLGVRRAIRTSLRKRRFAWAAGLAAAIALLIGSQFASRSLVPDARPPRERVASATQGDEDDAQPGSREMRMAIEQPDNPAPGSPSADHPRVLVRLQPVESPSQVVVPIATQSRSVTLVMLYPTIGRAAADKLDHERENLPR